MTQVRFEILCSEQSIDPSIALENEKLVSALKSRNDKEVERILKEEF